MIRGTTTELLQEQHDKETVLRTLTEKLNGFEVQAMSIRKEMASKQARINEIEQELERRNRKVPEPRVSDHAVIRYIERYLLGQSLDDVRKMILTPDNIAKIKAGVSSIYVDGVKFTVRDGVVTTVLTNEQAKHRSPLKKKDEGRPSEEPSLKEGLDEFYAELEDA